MLRFLINMGINYLSKGKYDWRLTASVKGLSFLELVGSEEMPGTIRYNIKHLEVEDSPKS